jgi:hypothetical protein
MAICFAVVAAFSRRCQCPAEAHDGDRLSAPSLRRSGPRPLCGRHVVEGFPLVLRYIMLPTAGTARWGGTRRVLCQWGGEHLLKTRPSHESAKRDRSVARDRPHLFASRRRQCIVTSSEQLHSWGSRPYLKTRQSSRCWPQAVN